MRTCRMHINKQKFQLPLIEDLNTLWANLVK